MKEAVHKKLNELQATAICGNDISSSCPYVSANHHVCRPICLDILIISWCCFVLFRKYGEVVGISPQRWCIQRIIEHIIKRLASIVAT
jgi:hypothetical protein